MPTMVESASQADPPRRPLHPFFAPNRITTTITDKPRAENGNVPSTADTTANLPQDANENGAVEKAKNGSKKRVLENNDNENDEESKKPRKKRGRPAKKTSVVAHFADVGESEDVALNEGVTPVTLKTGASHLEDKLSSSPKTSEEDCGSLTHQPNTTDTGKLGLEGQLQKRGDTQSHPKKLLVFNPKTGTIGSPPKPKGTQHTRGETAEGQKQGPSRRGKKTASKIVCISYGTDVESRTHIGGRIDSILTKQTHHNTPNSKTQFPTPEEDSSSKPPTAVVPNPPKATHPFFMGKVKKTKPAPHESHSETDDPTTNTKIFTTTPRSPRKARVPVSAKLPMPQFGVKKAGLKFPGAKLPAWPWKNMVHVRGEEDLSGVPEGIDEHALSLAARKSKGRSVGVPDCESIIALATQRMEIPMLAEAVRNTSTNMFLPPPPELRLPQKILESGSKLQARILPELKTFMHPAPGKQLARQKSSSPVDGDNINVQPPPQLARLYESIASSLPELDKSLCEAANWTQKYAPVSAVEVLQPDEEAFTLRKWLQTLVVQSVHTGSADGEKVKGGSKKKDGTGKRKRRKRLDGFIVSSDDEDYEELSDDEGNWFASGTKGIRLPTVVKKGNITRGDKILNTLIISGPAGCGKTAMVHAVANELDFEVFEINSSSRRSGKDVLARIGDMTRNHHVQQYQSNNTADGDSPAAEDETANDIKSGKQSTMAAFFKPKAAPAKAKQPLKTNTAAQQKKVKDDKEVKREPPKNQRQSLILLEEVDILYEEDKQFWATLVELICQSKRPFIMTCNDETIIPLQLFRDTSRLYGVFRLRPPPRDLAIDRLLLIAANEGHVLDRRDVETLYDSRCDDLRAATTELQYWCQIGVGSPRRWLDWFLPRWPKGIDLDENGETIRVVSKGTYQSGMNLLGRDRIVDAKATPALIEEELVHQASSSWNMDIWEVENSQRLASWAQELSTNIVTRKDRLAALEAFDEMADAVSVADMCSLGFFAPHAHQTFDVTQPEPSAKAHDDLIQGRPHLDTPRVAYYDELTADIPSALKLLAKSSMQARVQGLMKDQRDQLQPLRETQALHCLQTYLTSDPPEKEQVRRIDLAYAFDPLAVADPYAAQPLTYLDPSVFDRTTNILIEDVAPYVRGIIAHDTNLAKQRLKLSNLVSEGGKPSQGSKRMRTTRAALSAMEGGSRSTTRADKWFKADINPYLVAKTGGKGWTEGLDADELRPSTSPYKSPSKSSATDVSPDVSPVKAPKKKGRGLRGRPKKVIVDEEDEDLVEGDV
ncbi:hypothetical protein QBC35DRAFT_499454 [Podospora australis]|uniref:AAA+ ATPase domain-containing protein n=1 Tax=Podospora australis TaxID=1536484 RepID=A0AAN6WRT8_9PEZI|nr:hypothetical protein QBC35DRAFT_499454 [Podospora australis]